MNTPDLITVALSALVSAIVSVSVTELRDRWKVREKHEKESKALAELFGNAIKRDLDFVLRGMRLRPNPIPVRQLREYLEAQPLWFQHGLYLQAVNPSAANVVAEYYFELSKFKMELEYYNSDWDRMGYTRIVVSAANKALSVMGLPPEQDMSVADN